MNRTQIRNKIKRFEKLRDNHLQGGRPVSAAMEQRVVDSLNKVLETKIGGSPVE